jgi:hypothetical protein
MTGSRTRGRRTETGGTKTTGTTPPLRQICGVTQPIAPETLVPAPPMKHKVPHRTDVAKPGGSDPSEEALGSRDRASEDLLLEPPSLTIDRRLLIRPHSKLPAPTSKVYDKPRCRTTPLSKGSRLSSAFSPPERRRASGKTVRMATTQSLGESAAPSTPKETSAPTGNTACWGITKQRTLMKNRNGSRRSSTPTNWRRTAAATWRTMGKQLEDSSTPAETTYRPSSRTKIQTPFPTQTHSPCSQTFLH